ncbi:MAG: UvrD-helicase domain-containing protein, partial [Bacilli bacterium]|nr:UvrD-helicase domain-containing protein [Bacilli bacterium]
MMKWTEEQQLAIDKEGCNIIVSAGAGSGKTAVLSERVLRKVKEGVDIRKILILTFTNEAAGEMKNRIRNKLKKSKLDEQLEYIDSAYITTFDAYALSLVKKYHYLLNISKNISIIDSSIIDLEKNRIIDEIFLEMYERKDEDFLSLVGDFTERDDTVIKEAILSISKTLDLKYDKKEYLMSYEEEFYKHENIENLFQEYFQYLKVLVEQIEDIILALGEIVDEKLYTKLYDAYSPLFKPRKYSDLARRSIPSIQFRNVPEEAIPYKDSLKVLREEFLELTQDTEEELKEYIKSTKGYVRAIIKVIMQLDERLDEYKLKCESFEFSDIAKMAIRIVQENETICEELKNTYNEILIDEYQDTNDLQEVFVSLIQNDNVYMVGDIKQSIYRFRNANPNIFKNKYDCYSRGENGFKIDLVKNFRSRREVLNNINEIFNFIMTEEVGGVNYPLNHAMVYGNLAYIEMGENNYDNNMEIMKYDNEGKEFSDTEIEAFTIAQDIKKKIQSKYQVYDFGLKSLREVRLSDFCIILDRGS